MQIQVIIAPDDIDLGAIGTIDLESTHEEFCETLQKIDDVKVMVAFLEEYKDLYIKLSETISSPDVIIDVTKSMHALVDIDEAESSFQDKCSLDGVTIPEITR